jgi:hypothetical protein
MALAIGFIATLVGLPQTLELMSKSGWHAGMLACAIVAPTAISCALMLAWIIADSGNDRVRRGLRMAIALLLGSLLAIMLEACAWYLVGGYDFMVQIAHGKGKPLAPPALLAFAEYLNLLLIGGLVYAIAELLVLRRRTERAVVSVLTEQAAMSREALESRLAAMQAQVEPRFLFESLVDIERLYERDPDLASDILDRLIAYLRSALPRLRQEGSTIGAECELVEAYLAVVAALHGGRPSFSARIEPGCRQARFYPMLLLPIVQRAVRRDDAELPRSFELRADRDGEGICLELDIDAADLCSPAPELDRVRERLHGLYGARAMLECRESDGLTRFSLRLLKSA